MARIKLSMELNINGQTVDPFKVGNQAGAMVVKFDGTSCIGPKTVKKNDKVTIDVGPTDKLPIMLLIVPTPQQLVKGQLVYATEFTPPNIPPGTDQVVADLMKRKQLETLPSITGPLLFFNNGQSPFPTLESVTQLTLWNLGNADIDVDIIKTFSPA